MLERLSHIIKNKQLSSSQFADEIGVQRSSVSHVLSGRNKPSLDFITKVILRFPEINPEWLLTGRGSMDADQAPLESEEAFDKNQVKISGPRDEEAVPYITQRVPNEESPKRKTGKRSTPTGSAMIEKIVIFYTDGSFSEYNPHG